jgi:hypothetical protein
MGVLAQRFGTPVPLHRHGAGTLASTERKAMRFSSKAGRFPSKAGKFPSKARKFTSKARKFPSKAGRFPSNLQAGRFA